ncbi:peptide chain release factor N(5)-glutamine methyltransferase, partial [Ornithinicoccus halotolerans]|uniref:peptide chain release factor N(5)-glutamine methyltransferase n=1 Tax=Ornithinicoccus halotolerans TaxID=1748220 RepID=UPI0012971161
VQPGARPLSARLAGAGVTSPRADAETLLAHVLGVERGELRRLVALGRDVEAAAESRYQGLVDQRGDRVPLQHLTGEAHFHGVTLAVGPGVFVPRPETETLVERALALLAGGGPAPVVVDLCAGSGAVAVAIARARPDAEVHAVEVSAYAHAWAERNIAAHAPQVRLVLGDAGTALPELDSRVDLVVSNPPYIPPGQVPVDPEVARHDPPEALYGGGGDGLSVPLLVASRARSMLRPGGRLLLEHGEEQGAALKAALLAQGWQQLRDHPDLTGRPRVLHARR